MSTDFNKEITQNHFIIRKDVFKCENDDSEHTVVTTVILNNKRVAKPWPYTPASTKESPLATRTNYKFTHTITIIVDKIPYYEITDIETEFLCEEILQATTNRQSLIKSQFISEYMDSMLLTNMALANNFSI